MYNIKIRVIERYTKKIASNYIYIYHHRIVTNVIIYIPLQIYTNCYRNISNNYKSMQY